MEGRAEAVNAQLLEAFPKGFPLGAAHKPHISILQRYVRTADLGRVHDAVSTVLAGAKPAGWKLKAFKYYYIPWKGLGLAGIVIVPTADLLALQQSLVDAVAPFTEKMGTAAAFATTPDDPGAAVTLSRSGWWRAWRARARAPTQALTRQLRDSTNGYTVVPTGGTGPRG